jgi:flagellin-specific chaperone FliS
MLIAQEKRKENIAEYILYMWQVEDTIRACNFDMDLLEEKIISQFSSNNKIKQEISNWYANLIVMMHEENIKETGHLAMINTIINDLNDLHKQLLVNKKDTKYLEQYFQASPNIHEIEKRLGREPVNEIDTCLTALYALLLMRLKKREITRETLEAMQTFSNLLALLSNWYKKAENGGADV